MPLYSIGSGICIVFCVLSLEAGGGDANVEVSQFPPDMNVRINHIMNSDWVCNTTVPRRNGFIYSHDQALLQNEKGSNLNYPDNIDCRLLVTVGQGVYFLLYKYLYIEYWHNKELCSKLNAQNECVYNKWRTVKLTLILCESFI